jgi:hypothetical protein
MSLLSGGHAHGTAASGAAGPPRPPRGGSEPKVAYRGGPGISKKEAELTSEALTAISKEKGRLDTGEQIDEFIARARPKSSPTHELFEWDLAKGHALYLKERARNLITGVYVVFEDAPQEPVRAFPIVTHQGKRGPLPMQRVLSNKDLTKAMLEQALADLEHWQRRYDRLETIAKMRGVFAAIKKVTRPVS